MSGLSFMKSPVSVAAGELAHGLFADSWSQATDVPTIMGISGTEGGFCSATPDFEGNDLAAACHLICDSLAQVLVTLNDDDRHNKIGPFLMARPDLAVERFLGYISPSDVALFDEFDNDTKSLAIRVCTVLIGGLAEWLQGQASAMVDGGAMFALNDDGRALSNWVMAYVKGVSESPESFIEAFSEPAALWAAWHDFRASEALTAEPVTFVLPGDAEAVREIVASHRTI